MGVPARSQKIPISKRNVVHHEPFVIFSNKNVLRKNDETMVVPSPGRDCNQMIIFPPVKLGDVLEQAFYCTPSYFPLLCALYFVFRALLCFVFRISRSSVLHSGLIPGLCMRRGFYFGAHSYFGVTPRRHSGIQPANF